jgi:hypothetical protein
MFGIPGMVTRDSVCTSYRLSWKFEVVAFWACSNCFTDTLESVISSTAGTKGLPDITICQISEYYTWYVS